MDLHHPYGVPIRKYTADFPQAAEGRSKSVFQVPSAGSCVTGTHTLQTHSKTTDKVGTTTEPLKQLLTRQLWSKIKQEFKPAQPQLTWSEQTGEHSSDSRARCNACSSWRRAHIMTFPVPNAYGKNQVPCKNTGSPSLFQHHTDGQEVFSEWLTVPDPRAWCQKHPDTSIFSVVQDLHTFKLMGLNV